MVDHRFLRIADLRRIAAQGDTAAQHELQRRIDLLSLKDLSRAAQRYAETLTRRQSDLTLSALASALGALDGLTAGLLNLISPQRPAGIRQAVEHLRSAEAALLDVCGDLCG